MNSDADAVRAMARKQRCTRTSESHCGETGHSTANDAGNQHEHARQDELKKQLVTTAERSRRRESSVCLQATVTLPLEKMTAQYSITAPARLFPSLITHTHLTIGRGDLDVVQGLLRRLSRPLGLLLDLNVLGRRHVSHVSRSALLEIGNLDPPPDLPWRISTNLA